MPIYADDIGEDQIFHTGKENNQTQKAQSELHVLHATYIHNITIAIVFYSELQFLCFHIFYGLLICINVEG